MYISDLADLFDPVRLFFKDQLIRFQLKHSTEPQSKDHAAGRDLACPVFKHLVLLQLDTDGSDCVSPRSFLRFFRIIASRPIFLAIAINLLLNVFVPDIIPAPECKVYSPDRTRYYCTPCALYSKTIKEILWRLGLI